MAQKFRHFSTKSFLTGFLFSEAKLPHCLDIEHF